MIPITSSTDAGQLVRSLLAVPSERDKQRTIGASSFGSPCDYCVAQDLVNGGGENEYALATSIGTAIHSHLEVLEAEHLEGAIIEEKIVLGELDGYGLITSKPDLVLPLPLEEGGGSDQEWWLCDWKTTQQKKLKDYRKAYETEEAEHEFATLTSARFTMQKYLGQLMSYGRGLHLAGYNVQRMSMVFIPRDGKKLKDIEAFDFWYDQEYADLVWHRLESLWEYVAGGGEVEDLSSAPGCFPCEVSGRV